jgi:hypothetical protein
MTEAAVRKFEIDNLLAGYKKSEDLVGENAIEGFRTRTGREPNTSK